MNPQPFTAAEIGPTQATCPNRRHGEGSRQQGVVLPIALIMLVILTLAGLLAARNASVTEQISNNLRTTNVAQQAAEAGLRYCEAVVIDKVDNAGKTYTTEVAKIVTSPLLTSATDTANAKWYIKANWTLANNQIDLPITAYKDAGTTVKSTSLLTTAPACIIQALSPLSSNFYLITAKGTSNTGSTVWLQSLISPGAPAVPP
jgi:type IV pilus assembly protein PilX